jgi:GNAT superfamily N-acetyltransferase
MFVRSDWTRRGLGRAILESCERAAREAGFHTLALMATLPGVPLYRSYGFTEVETTTVTMPDGVVIATVAMQRSICPAGR